jgi:phage terminase small subunit
VNGLALTVKQEKFCLEYAKSGNARQAYKKAGYNCKNDASTDASASKLLSNVKVKARLAELAEEAKNNAIADIQEMQEKLTEIIRQQLEEEVIVVDPLNGAIKVKKTASVKDIISAVNTLGKMQGAFTEKLDVKGAVSVVIVDDLDE